jgi:hypothetical protein
MLVFSMLVLNIFVHGNFKANSSKLWARSYQYQNFSTVPGCSVRLQHPTSIWLDLPGGHVCRNLMSDVTPCLTSVSSRRWPHGNPKFREQLAELSVIPYEQSRIPKLRASLWLKSRKQTKVRSYLSSGSSCRLCQRKHLHNELLPVPAMSK